MYTKKAEGKAHATVVIVHGAGEHHGRYDWLTKQWNRNGYHVVLGDLPGQGKTAGLRGYIRSFEDYIYTIESWVEQAKAFELPIVLLGHSMGGLAAIRTIKERTLPICAVVLSSPCLGLVKEPPKALDRLTSLLNIVCPRLRLETNVEAGIGTRNEQIKARDAVDPLYNRKVSVRWYYELRKAMELAQEDRELPNIPFLVLQGGDDRIVNKHDVKAWFERLDVQSKEYKEWAHLYHEVFNEPERNEVFDYTLQYVQQQIHS